MLPKRRRIIRKEGEQTVKYERWQIPAVPEGTIKTLTDAGYPYLVSSVLAESLVGESGSVPLSPRAPVEQVYDAAVKAGRGGSVTLNAVPVAQNTKSGRTTSPRTITQEELAAYLADDAAQQSRSGRFDSSYLLIREKDGSVTTVWYESETDLAEKTELCRLLGVKTVYILK